MPRRAHATVVAIRTLLAIGTLLVTACATMPPSRPVSDLKSIAGLWKGQGGLTTGGVSTTGPVELTIREDGTGEFFLPQLAGGTRSQATLKVSDGKLLYETATSKGTATLREGDGKRILAGQSSRKDGSGTGWMELSSAK